MYRYNHDNNKEEKTYFIDLRGTWLSKVIIFIFGGGIIYLALWVMFFMGILLYIGEYRKSLKYVETIGTNESFESCSNGGYCSDRYVFEVEGQKYYAHYNVDSDFFDRYEKVYYNPKNPNENMIFSNWWTLILGSGAILFIMYFMKWKIKSYIKNANVKNNNKPINV